MRFSIHAYVKTIFITFVFFTSNVIAATCYDQSQGLMNEGEEYYNLEEPVTLSNDEQNQIKSLFKQLQGKWKGNGIHIECLGPDNAPEEQINNVKLRIKTESNGPLHIAFNSEIKNLKNSVTRTDRMDLLGTTPAFSFKSLGQNHLTFSEKYRSASGGIKNGNKRFTRLIENVYEIKLNGSHFKLIKTYYINGIYVAKDEWNLQPGL